MPAVAALKAFACFGFCSFSQDYKRFFLENVALGPIADRVGRLSCAP
jgi:hypothetical protein